MEDSNSIILMQVSVKDIPIDTAFKVPKLLVLNLPATTLLTRRYMCSYSSPVSLLPPLELLSVASACRKEGLNVFFKDAIAENVKLEALLKYIHLIEPEYIITLTGIETIEEDLKTIDSIKINFPLIKIFVFGHFPTIFTNEILEKSLVDGIIPGEPEIAIKNYFKHKLNSNDSRHGGIIFKNQHDNNTQNLQLRLNEIISLDTPAYDLMKAELYFEPFMKNPFAMVQTARGCPYKCNYCIKSYGYGNKVTMRSAEQIVEELEMLIDIHKIRSFRFIDDTFTVSKKRVIDICNLMIEKKLNLSWTCLSRTDNIKADMLVKMKQAGCKRIYFGVESGSQKMLDFYEKEINVNDALRSLLLTKSHGIETTGFFMLGLPNESEEDFNETVNFAINAKLSMAAVEGIKLYPGTALFEKYKEMIDFSIIPYVNQFIDPQVEITHSLRKNEFYRKFYYRPEYLIGKTYSQLKDIPAFFNTFQNIAKRGFKNFQFMPGIKHN